MRLISLTANKSSFQKINFKDGVNLIVGSKNNPKSDDLKDTYNGVGKSLIIQLVHFCLGCESIKEFEKKLPGWEFQLEFSVDNKPHCSTRGTKEQRKVNFDGEQISIDQYKNILKKIVFNLEPSVKYLSFRSLISRFIRPSKGSYLSFDTYIPKETDFYKLLNNAYLLGLDIEPIIRKRILKTEYERVKELKKNLQSDEIFNEYFTDGQNIDIEIIDTKDKIKKLEKDLSLYKVSEDYYQIQSDSDRLKNELTDVKNQILLLNNSIEYINKSLVLKTDLNSDRLIKFYEEASIVLSNHIIKTIKDVETFHRELSDSRATRLTSERIKLREQKQELDLKRKKLSANLDNKLKYLGTHGALDEFVVLNESLSELLNKLDKLNTYNDLQSQYKSKLEGFDLEFDQEKVEASKYLITAKTILENNIRIFRSLSKEFYQDKPGGIVVTNNEGTNQLRFNIDAKIEDDASDGINEVKIFCFDLTLLLAKNRHNVDFIFHDSRLFSNMDPRQFTTLLKIAQKKAGITYQYIASVNENLLNDAKEYLKSDFQQIVEENVILRLTDESEKSKLLGIQIDMDYESR